MRVGIIACRHYWNTGCPGYGSHVLCFQSVAEKKGPLGQFQGAQIITLRPCPGCPGDQLSSLVADMVAKDRIQVIALASCLFLGDHCPAAADICRELEKSFAQPVLRGTYIAAEKAVQYRTVRRQPPGIPSVSECLRRLSTLRYLASL
ncbi:MAG: CGGC domain-containing protein [Moorellaceae bacterium]